MKIADIVTQLVKIVPQVSDLFADSLPVVSIVGDGALVTVTTIDDHNLQTGAFVNLSGVAVETDIVNAVLTGSIASIETATPHDLTLGWPPHKSVQLTGFTDPQWNASFTLLDVPNRKNFDIDATGLSAPTLTGSEKLLELVLGKFNGPATITRIDATTFTFPAAVVGTGIGGLVQGSPRIAGVVNAVRAFDAYTEQNLDDWWLFVAQQQTSPVNKSRRADTDLNSEMTLQTDFQEYISDGFIIFAVGNASENSAGLETMDIARHDILPALLAAVRGLKTPSGLCEETNLPIDLISHGFAIYSGAIYAHQYVFQAPQLLTRGDTVQPETVAFRDVDYNQLIPFLERITLPIIVSPLAARSIGQASVGSVFVGLAVSPLAARAIGQASVGLVFAGFVVSPLAARSIGQASGPDIPSTVAGLLVWLDAADTDTITDINDMVTAWDDKSGNNHTATAGGFRPITNLNTIGGLNAIFFDNVEDVMELPDIAVFDNFWSTGGTIVFVSQSYSLGENDAGRFFDKEQNWRTDKMPGGTGALGIVIKFSGVDAVFKTVDDSFPVPIPGTPSTPSSPAIVTITYDGSNLTEAATFYVDGVPQALATETLPTGTMEVDAQGPLRIGGRHITDRSIDADYGEIIFYDLVLPTAERDVLHTYLSNKWSIPLS